MKRLILRQWVVLMLIATLGGCAWWQERNDPWLRLKRTDFTEEGAMFGKVSLFGYETGQWIIHGYLKDLDTSKKKTLNLSETGFFRNLPPGKYQLRLSHLSQTIDNQYNYGREIPLNYESQVYDLAAGDALYVGDILIGLRPYVSTDTSGIKKLMEMAFGSDEGPLKINTEVKDVSFNKLKMIQERYPQRDYRFKTSLATFKKP